MFIGFNILFYIGYRNIGKKSYRCISRMNEQELANFAGLMTGKNVTTVTDANPRISP